MHKVSVSYVKLFRANDQESAHPDGFALTAKPGSDRRHEPTCIRNKKREPRRPSFSVVSPRRTGRLFYCPQTTETCPHRSTVNQKKRAICAVCRAISRISGEMTKKTVPEGTAQSTGRKSAHLSGRSGHRAGFHYRIQRLTLYGPHRLWICKRAETHGRQGFYRWWW